MRTLSIFASSIALLTPLAARAEEDGWRDSSVRSGLGIDVVLGAGVTGFTDRTIRDTVAPNVGGLWNLRITLGSHMAVAIEGSYVGTVVDIDSRIGSQRATLVGTGFEGVMRFNSFPRARLTPYGLIGLGWQRYDITGADMTLARSGMNASDSSLVFPMGLGISYRDRSGLVVDVRATLRANGNPGLVLQEVGGTDYARMHSWDASGAVGYEF